MQTWEALSAHTLHHRHHAVVLSIPSTTPPYLARRGRRSHWCAVRMHLSEASPLKALDRIGSRGGDGQYDYIIDVLLNISAVRFLQGYEDLIYLSRCFASPRSDLGLFLFVIVGKFLFSMLRDTSQTYL
jgi:hypothetical protein